ncbi:hypothetical protein M0812_13384 [Anaeramoeba flamelloides]|uniref:START domain-containing protein n=1 Tax=Anaeramoeba flamelloides TaxID=1746091 RepID=A0AAV7ZHG7_9EUKA|nr:hypothetical protein M0812_13384 [Anaeramoeba flamelloides]|eukprot:Anaeramoba_flamelloidesa2670_128.p1 GENE.a2670_128~~a2670_128.p1  ORF type:complete len:260 (-),score=75.03 a2670_128:309-1088(-)
MSEKQQLYCFEMAKKGIETVIDDLTNEDIEWEKDKLTGNVMNAHRSSNNKYNKFRMTTYHWGITPKELLVLSSKESARLKWDTQTDSITNLIEHTPPTGYDTLTVTLTCAKKLMGGLVSARHMRMCMASKQFEDGRIVCGYSHIEDIKKAGCKKTKLPGTKATTFPSGFILTPVTRKQFKEFLKTEEGKKITPDPLWELEGDENEVVGTIYDIVVHIDLGGWFAAWQINKFASGAFSQGIQEMDKYIRGDYREVQQQNN